MVPAANQHRRSTVARFTCWPPLFVSEDPRGDRVVCTLNMSRSSPRDLSAVTSPNLAGFCGSSPPQQLFLWTLSLWRCSLQRLKQQVAEYTSLPALHLRLPHHLNSVTPSLPWRHLKMTNRSTRFEILIFFLFFFFFRISVSKELHKTHSIKRAGKYAVCCLQVCVCIFQPRNLTGWGSDGANICCSGGGQSFLENSATLSAFKSQLKTFLFSEYFS